MNSKEIRQKFLKFYEAHGHKIVPSSSLIPENDPSVLFTTAGMQQFKPYYAGEDAKKAFGSLNTTSVQKCMRTSDIEEVGDERHLTFFEMLGNFSFGGYFKEEAIKFAHEFVTKEMGLKIDYITVFEGEGIVPADDESAMIWQKLDPKITVKKFGRADNFWGPTGDEGPCGPTTEIYVDGIEIWNIVFNEYFQAKDGSLTPLKTKGIDTGMGLERLAKVSQKVGTVFETDLFTPIIGKIKEIYKGEDEKAVRIISDHIRSSVFLLSDGVVPMNTGQGYILRRLIRRAVRYTHSLGLRDDILIALVNIIIKNYEDQYPELFSNTEKVISELKKEEEKFRNTLEKGLKEFEKGEDPFILFTTYGFPIELTLELAKENNKEVNLEDFNAKMKAHQAESRKGAEHKFKGGLADTDPKTVRLHTAHHLLLAALQKTLGKGVKQRGSNITQERLRIDFAFDRKMTDEEKKQVEDMVNQKIKDGLEVVKCEMPKTEAEQIGAEMEFGAKYGDMVTVYMIKDKSDKLFSAEFCGGPHVGNTNELGQFKIQKEEAVASGVRRIKAILQ
jgi:alanyl-tRNA synthetase